MSSTNNTIDYNAVTSDVIYTRKRQMEHRNKLQNKTHTKKINNKALLAFVIIVPVLFFCACIGMIYFKSVISKVQMDINNINSEIRIMEQENSRLRAEEISAIDIDHIKTAARKMGMSLPLASQVEHVDALGNEDSTALKIVD
jgi:cell division protein FtsL